MPRLSRRVCLAAAVLAGSCLGRAVAAPPSEQLTPADWSAMLGIGVEYDRNVSVEEVDATTNEGDYAMTLDAGLGVKKQLSTRTQAALTYDFSQSIYDKFSQVDRQTHMVGADLGLELGRLDPSVSVYYINSHLDGSKFLELVRVSPAVSGFLAQKWFARGAYVYSDKTIHQRAGRDASTNAAEADVYFFVRGLRQYFNLGYRFRHENADADQYDYESNGVKLRFIQRFELFSRLTKLELAVRYEDRSYRSDTPAIGEKRDDERTRLRLDYEVPIIAGAAVQFFAGYADYESNYEPANYDQTIVGTRFLYNW
ncbi:MAG: surface lipoprotein assembly modifier [Halieaceae bacterium]|jgi:hypothetical protein|nr:surface lipoprotein assembly modifier [Halieaceae bacterium]